MQIQNLITEPERNYTQAVGKAFQLADSSKGFTSSCGKTVIPMFYQQRTP